MQVAESLIRNQGQVSDAAIANKAQYAINMAAVAITAKEGDILKCKERIEALYKELVCEGIEAARRPLLDTLIELDDLDIELKKCKEIHAYLSSNVTEPK